MGAFSHKNLVNVMWKKMKYPQLINEALGYTNVGNHTKHPILEK